ncbi:allantoate deiminase [Aneurinibacillus terranovensis]|uniref:allantoate deiminase n=1 Tax=Aneurinibacillus terranovensis TaxID=278991 RepID=UPI00041EB7F6|nr:allantoate deiminase [Aneurinibacillus terranovensis]
MKIADLQQRMEEMVHWLATYGADPEGGVTRLLYTSSWTEAQQALEQKMRESGLETYYDEVGNLYGRLTSANPEAGTILTGSHVDTVKCGGKYDGAFGILAGLLALRYLKETYGPPMRNIEVVSLCEEEGSRFPLTFWGSTNITGTAPVNKITQIQDAGEIPFMEAMKEAGFGLGYYRNPRREDILSFIELHIEQGAILEREKIPIGIVEQIVGQKRYTIECIGEANHAGTTPMVWRKDALRGSSQMILSIMESADRIGAPLVATVGKIEMEPNVSNVIPGKATFTLDIRHPQGDVLDAFCAEAIESCYAIARNRGLQVKVEKHMDARPVEMDESLISRVKEICRHQDLPYKLMPSGAGHDAQIMAPHHPTSLIFVPSHRGISHNPAEYTSKEDLTAGVQVLIELLYQLGYEGGEINEIQRTQYVNPNDHDSWSG